MAQEHNKLTYTFCFLDRLAHDFLLERPAERMSCIYLHLGQAGNQIGKSFWGLAEEEYLIQNGSGASRAGSHGMTKGHGLVHLRPGGTGMFHEDGWARCLAVDSEPNVRE